MRLNLTLFFLLLISFSANAQKITGIWRGYFSSSSGAYRDGIKEETYKYEIQLDQQGNNSVKGVTYSYKSTIFYGKAELNGIYTPASKSIIIKEIKLVDLKIGDRSEPCLMTCYLDYTKMGKLEVLEGTFISTNVKDKGDCGSGKVYLERVTASDFKPEEFLLKKKKSTDPAKLVSKVIAQGKSGLSKSGKTATTPALTKKPVTKNNLAAKTPVKKPVVTIPPSTKKTTAKVTAPVVKKTVPKPIITGNNKPIRKAEKPADRIPEKLVNANKAEAVITPTPENLARRIPIPKVLVERENKLVRTITTSEENIQIDLYDNGIIDNDTISVYHNNELILSNRQLNYTPITIRVKCSKTDNRHEFVMVAENLGDIPPNAAMMVIKAGKERYEVFITSTEQRNAKIIINYVPKE